MKRLLSILFFWRKKRKSWRDYYNDKWDETKYWRL